MPSLGIVRVPKGCIDPLDMPTQEHDTGCRRLSDGCQIYITGDWGSGNPAFAISRGSPGAPLRPSGHGRRFSGML